MSKALSMVRGQFGRVALLNMTKSLVRHAHSQCHVLLKVGGAEQAMIVDGKECILAEDTAILINTWCEHTYSHTLNDDNCIILAFYIEPDWLASLDEEMSLSRHPGFFPSPCVQVSPIVQKMAANIAQCLLYEQSVSTDSIEIPVFDLMTEIISEFSLWREPGNAIFDIHRLNDFRIRRAVDLLHIDKGRTCDVNDLVFEAGLSRPRFFELFKEQTGVTPVIYSNVLRIESAMDYLGKSAQSIINISHDHGFEEQSNFTRFFSQHTGIPPASYRRIITEYGSKTRL